MVTDAPISTYQQQKRWARERRSFYAVPLHQLRSTTCCMIKHNVHRLGVCSGRGMRVSHSSGSSLGKGLGSCWGNVFLKIHHKIRSVSDRVVPHPFTLLSQKNDKVQKLEDECDWYRKEALRLDSFNTAMKKDLKYMKGKLEILGGS